MDGRGRGALAACAVAVVLAGCGTSGACTAIGAAEGVSVDLTRVLDLEADGYVAEVEVAEVGTARSSGPGARGTSTWLETDLSGAPVTVTVVVRDGSGAVAHAAEDVATPQLHQPNGPRCDGENYRVDVVAEPDGSLTAPPVG